MEGKGLIGILILIGDIYAVLQIFESNASTMRKAVWIALVILLPFVGLVIWYLFGPKKSAS